MIRIRVNGIPAPQGSKRHVGGGRMVESSKAVGPWREAVRAEAQRVMLTPVGMGARVGPPPVDCAVGVTVTFLLPRPAGHYGTGRNAGTVKPSSPARPATKPDLDKLARAVLDGLVMGGVMADDAQVVDLTVSKVWANGQAPGAVIEVEAAGG